MKFSIIVSKRLLCAAIGLGVLFDAQVLFADPFGAFSLTSKCCIQEGEDAWNTYNFSSLESGRYVDSESLFPNQPFSIVNDNGYDYILDSMSYDSENLFFKGWFTKYSGWTATPTADDSDAPDCITTKYEITSKQIKSAGKFSPKEGTVPIVVLKFAHLYSITAEIVPDEAKQGGTISISGESEHGGKYEEGTDVTLSVNLEDGFSVDYWEKDGVRDPEAGAKSSITVEVTGNAEYKVCLKGKFKVSFNSFGGGGTDEMDVTTGEVPSHVNKVAGKDGATFTGYYLTPSGEGEYPYWDIKGQWRGGVVPSSDPCTIPWSIYSNVTVYARYEENTYTVKFDSNGGKGEGDKDKSVTYTQQYELPDGENLSKDNYSFGGWAMSADADKKVYDGDTKRTVEDEVKKYGGDIVDGVTLTYYAFWKDMRRTVRFVAGSDEVTLSTNGVVLSTNEMKKVAGEKYGELPTAVWDGDRYEFDGWWTAPEGGDPVNADSTVPDQDDISLYAHWAPNSYYIAFDGRGATGGAMAVEEFKFDQPQALTANGFEKTGCGFRGWATNLNTLSVALADGAVVSNLLATVKDETNTIYAVWKGNSYSVRFFGNGGTNEMSNQEFEYGVAQKLTANAFGRANYEFIGWAKDPAQAVAYTDEQEVSNLSAKEGAIVPLYAKWKWTGVEPTELSIAADCDKLALTTNEVGVTVETYTNGEERVGLNNQYILMCPPYKMWENTGVDLVLGEIKGPGVLSFYFKTTFLKQDSLLTIKPFGNSTKDERSFEKTVSSWTLYSYTNRTDLPLAPIIQFGVVNQEGSSEKVYIDYVTWTPEEETEQTVGVTFRLNDGTSAPADIYDNVTRVAGAPIGELPELESEEGKYFAGWMTEPAGGNPIGSGWIVPAADVQLYAKWNSEEHPVPGPGDEAVIYGATVQDGRFVMAFSNQQQFAYEVWTNSNIAVTNGWALKDVTNSVDEIIIFSPEIDLAVPTMFYKVKTIQRP